MARRNNLNHLLTWIDMVQDVECEKQQQLPIMSIHVITRSNNTLCMRERTKLRRSRCVQIFFEQQLIDCGMLNRFIPLGLSLNTTYKCVCCHPMLCSTTSDYTFRYNMCWTHQPKSRRRKTTFLLRCLL